MPEKMFAGEVKLVHALRFALKSMQTAKVLTAKRGHAFAAICTKMHANGESLNCQR